MRACRNFPLALSILSSRNNIKIRRKFSPPPPIKINLAWILRETNLGWDGIDLISNFEGIERMKPDREIPHEHEISWISSVNTAFFFCRVRIAWIFESVQRGRFVKKWETVSIKFTCIEFCVFDTFYILDLRGMKFIFRSGFICWFISYDRKLYR